MPQTLEDLAARLRVAALPALGTRWCGVGSPAG